MFFSWLQMEPQNCNLPEHHKMATCSTNEGIFKKRKKNKPLFMVMSTRWQQEAKNKPLLNNIHENRIR